MSRGKVVLLVPSQTTTAGATKLEKELKQQKVKVLAKESGLVFAQWDDEAKTVVGRGPSIQAYHLEKISPTEIGRLDPPAARVAMLWNWDIDHSGKRIDDRAAKRLVKQLQLEVKQDEVHDLLTGKSLGKIKREKSEDIDGNWSLYQQRNKETWPLPGAFLIKLCCRSTTYAQYPTSRLIVDSIIAEVSGTKHYAHDHNYNTSSANACDWEAAWWWESWSAVAFSFASRNQENPPFRMILQAF